MTLEYRPEIDGLRAIAVLSVVLFHLDRSILPGGFVGVDIFFVISGFLITSLILANDTNGGFSLSTFYQRRIARIAPAFLVVAVTTLIVAGLIYSPQDFASTGATFAVAVLSLANMKFIYQGDYFRISPDAQPFLHYWSLSVEEQFYLLFPFALILLGRRGDRLRNIYLIVTFGLSLATCIVLTYKLPQWAFYSLPSRAWELLAGSIAAIYFPGSRRISFPSLLPAVRFVSLTTIFAGFFVLSSESRFPGFYAIIPVVGALGIVGTGSSQSCATLRILQFPVLVAIGKLSYSLYLWHYPIFCFVDYEYYSLSYTIRISLKIALLLILVPLCYVFIEVRSRNFLNRSYSKKFAFVLVAISLTVLVPLGLFVRSENYINAEASDVASGGITFTADEAIGTIVLMGDSNGSMYGRTVKEVARDLHYNLVVTSVAAGDPLPDAKAGSNQLWSDTLAVIQKTKPDFVIIGMAWSEKLKSDHERLDRALIAIAPYTKKVIILNQPPRLPPNASREAIREGSPEPFREVASDTNDRNAVNSYLLKHVDSNVSVIDVAKHFTRGDGSIFFEDESGRQLYQDAGHISFYGANLIVPELKGALDHRAKLQ